MNDVTTTPPQRPPETRPTDAPPRPWAIDPERSELRFVARSMGMTVRGRFPLVRGAIELHLDRLEDSLVDAVVETASVEPAMAALKGLLLSDGFLAAADHPELRFRSIRVQPNGDGYLVHGELTFRGELRPVALETRVGEIAIAGETPSVTIEAHGRVDHLMADEELEVELSLRAVPAAADARTPLHATGYSVRPVTDAPIAPPPAAPVGNAQEPEAPVHLLALVGSLRRGSLNRSLLRAAQVAAPRGVTIQPFSLAEVPFYDGDLEMDGDPVPVRALKEAIAGADGVLIVTPEYNRGLPAVVKNAIDWASRPAFSSGLTAKPVLLMGATTGRSAVKHALQQAADSLSYALALPFEERLGLPRAGDLIDDDGRLADAATLERLGVLLSHFRRFVIDTAAHHHAAA